METKVLRHRTPPAASRWQLLVALRLCLVAAMMSPPASAQATGADAARSHPLPNRLRVGTLVEFDGRFRSVGEAIRYLIEPVHYELTQRTVDARSSDAVLRRPIPAAAVDAGVMSIESALLLLIGEDNRLVVDHANHLIAIERMPDSMDLRSP